MSNASAVEALLFAALEKATDAERNAFLDSACDGDAELRRQVERLLKAEARVGGFLQKPVLEQWAAPQPSDELNRTTDHVPAAGSTDESHPAADAPEGGLPVMPGYRVLREIARGGMGRILAARDLTLDRDVALKVLLPGANPYRFVRESKISARLAHPGIPPVHALGTLADGSPFLAMKLIAGQTLAVEIKTADRPRLLQVFTQVCQAVGFAHSKGVVHRDLKPPNVMVGAFGEVQVMDWGLAKDLTSPDNRDEPGSSAAPARTTDHQAAAKSTDDQTRAGTILGTPAYMAPEQARGEPCEARSDVFALGGILCAILTGQAPYCGKSFVEVIGRARAADLAEAHARLDGCGADAELVALCRCCLNANPVDRPADGQAVADGLTTYLNGVQERLQAAQRERAVAMAREAEQRKRRRLALALAVTVLVAVMGGVVGTSLYLVQAQKARSDEALRAEAERERHGRNAEAVAGLLQQAEEALQAGDAAKASVLLDAAGKRAAEGGADELSGRHDRLRADLALLIALDELDLFRWTIALDDRPGRARFPALVAKTARLREALARFGLNPESPPEEASARVKGSAVQGRLVAYLDWWMGKERLPWVREVLRAADPDPFRDAVRDAVLADDLAELADLAGREQAANQPPGFVAVLGENKAIPLEQRRDLLTLAVRHNPGDLRILMNLGNIHEFLNDPDEMKRWFQAGVAVAPRNATAHHNLGIALWKKGDLNGAIVSLRKAVELATEASSHRLSMGVVLKDKGDLKGAIASYLEAIELDPEYARAYVYLGFALKDQGDLDGAIDRLRKAVELAPKDAWVHDSLGFVLNARGDLDGAIEQFRKAIHLDPEYGRAYANLGVALRAKGDLDGAIDRLHKAVELDPEYGRAYVHLGLALRAKGDLDGAIEQLRKAIRLDPNYALAHAYLGVTLRAKGDLDGAIDRLRKAVELAPKDALAYVHLGIALKDKGDLDGAIDRLREIVELAPKNAWVHDTLGYLLREKGDLDGAIDYFRKAIRLDPKYGKAYANLAETEPMAAVQGMLPALLKGDYQPQANDERLALAYLCKYKRRYRASAGLYADAFAADPRTAADLKAAHRYYAGCSAALAAAGQGEDAARLDDKEKARLRQQSLDWLRADLVLRTRQLESDRPADRAEVQVKLRHWQKDRALADIRDKDALAKLPAEERAEWEKLWADVAALLKKAETPAPKEDRR